jgi:REP-associated tyrosine transposase
MPSLPRYAILDHHSTFHVTWQCHNRDWLLDSDWAKRLYYNLLLKYKDCYRVRIYSYCFMSSHPHLTGYCDDKNLLSDFFRTVNSLFARIYNKSRRRKGQVVMDRFKSPRIETEADHLKVMFYNDLNPKRARVVIHPKDYAWSSFHFYAYGKEDPLLTTAPCYLLLGRTPKERQEIYRKMVKEILKNDWKEKRPYSSVYFIGNPEWVQKKNQEIEEIRQQKWTEWKERFKRKFASGDLFPPIKASN